MIDFHVAHNIVHADSGNNSMYCGYCNGSMDKKACETKAGEILKNQQMRSSMNRGPYYAKDKNKDNKGKFLATAKLTVHKRTVYPITEITAAEDGKLPKEIQIMPLGEWDTVPYGKLIITSEDITQMVDNFKKGVRAGIPIDVDHDGKAAAGWIKSLVAKDDGLFADVEWTALGEKLLGEKQYKFFSPEFNPEYTDPENTNVKLDNVLIAGSLVNRPLFKELQPLVASEGKTDPLTNKKGVAMLFIEPMKFDLKVLREKKADEVTADEKKFLQENLESLTADEKVKFGFEEKPKEKAKDDISGKEQVATIQASELKQLREDAAMGRKAAETLKTKEIEDQVGSWMFSEKGGHFQPAIKGDLVSFVKSLNDEQRKVFSELVAKMPNQKAMFSEQGSAEDLTKSQAADKLTLKAKELMAEAKKQNKNLSFKEATKQALRENPDLANYELKEVPGKVVANDRGTSVN